MSKEIDYMKVKVRTGDKEKTHRGYIGGFCLEKTIFLSSNSTLNNLSHFFHESGHIIGDSISFIDRSVLTPDEVKSTHLPLRQKDRLTLIKHFISIKNKPMDMFEEEIAKKTLKVYTKGNYDVDKIRLINLNKEQMRKVFNYMIQNEEDGETYEMGQEKGFVLKTTPEGVMFELPAFTVEKACKTILMNSLSFGEIFEFSLIFRGHAGSHKLAEKMVDKAYSKTGHILPSYYDYEKLSEKFNNLRERLGS